MVPLVWVLTAPRNKHAQSEDSILAPVEHIPHTHEKYSKWKQLQPGPQYGNLLLPAPYYAFSMLNPSPRSRVCSTPVQLVCTSCLFAPCWLPWYFAKLHKTRLISLSLSFLRNRWSSLGPEIPQYCRKEDSTRCWLLAFYTLLHAGVPKSEVWRVNTTAPASTVVWCITYTLLLAVHFYIAFKKLKKWKTLNTFAHINSTHPLSRYAGLALLHRHRAAYYPRWRHKVER